MSTDVGCLVEFGSASESKVAGDGDGKKRASSALSIALLFWAVRHMGLYATVTWKCFVVKEYIHSDEFLPFVVSFVILFPVLWSSFP